jgi:hypothetical protein
LELFISLGESVLSSAFPRIINVVSLIYAVSCLLKLFVIWAIAKAESVIKSLPAQVEDILIKRIHFYDNSKEKLKTIILGISKASTVVAYRRGYYCV